MKRAVLLALFLVGAVASGASADSISITSGSFLVEFGSNGKGRFDLYGTNDSRFAGSWDFGAVYAEKCSPCAPGDLVSTSALFASVAQYELTAARGIATVNGVTYPTPDFRWNFVEYGGRLEFNAAPIVAEAIPPAQAGDTVRLAYAVPFTLSGHLSGYDNAVYVGPREVFSADVSGQGTATLELLGYLNPTTGLTSWTFLRTTYAFAPEPVPEPASLLLLATGGAVLAFRRRKRQ